MGYQVTVKPNDNFDKFRTVENTYDTTRYTEKYLEYRVLSHGKKDLKDWDVACIMIDLEKQVDKLINSYVNREKVRLTTMFDEENPEYREKGELTFCGWELSKPEPVDLQDIKEYVTDRLFTLMTLTKDYDYFDESERFSEKASEILEMIEYLQDECAKSVDIDVINHYGESNQDNESK